MTRLLAGACALALLALPAGPARADAVPKLDIERTCKSANQVSVSDNASEEGCLRSEREAKRTAEQQWDTYQPAAKRQCEAQFTAGGYPSYVEMVTCLELASGTVPAQQAGGPAGGGPGAPGGGGKAPPEAGARNLTQEPPASLRINPIDVLKDK